MLNSMGSLGELLLWCSELVCEVSQKPIKTQKAFKKTNWGFLVKNWEFSRLKQDLAGIRLPGLAAYYKGLEKEVVAASV